MSSNWSTSWWYSPFHNNNQIFRSFLERRKHKLAVFTSLVDTAMPLTLTQKKISSKRISSILSIANRLWRIDSSLGPWLWRIGRRKSSVGLWLFNPLWSKLEPLTAQCQFLKRNCIGVKSLIPFLRGRLVFVFITVDSRTFFLQFSCDSSCSMYKQARERGGRGDKERDYSP